MRFQAIIFLTITFQIFSFAQTDISGIINDYTKVTAITSCPVVLTVQDASAFSVGDSVLIYQAQGAEIVNTNNANFGDVTNYNGAGFFEKNSISAINGQDIFLDNFLNNEYQITGNVQLISFPHFVGDVNVVGNITAQAFDGDIGGVLAFSASGTINLNADINVDGLGFEGGVNIPLGVNYNCNFLSNFNDYFYPLNDFRGSEKGVGIAEFIIDREAGRGKQANGGGGGNDHNSGAGGGSNAGSGGNGGDNDEPGTFNCNGFFPGIGGLALDYSDDRIFFGGGGGAGHGNNNTTNGGTGGGIIIINAVSIEGNNFDISASGNVGLPNTNDGASGGGGGGAIILNVNNYGATALNLFTQGGNGGNSININNRCYGPGGGGGGGAILTNTAFTGNVNRALQGGANGIVTTSTNACNGSALNSTPGQDGVELTNKNIPISDGVAPNVPGAITINSQPQDTTVCAGDTPIFFVDALGANLTYQWQQNTGGGWQDISDGAFFSGTTIDSLTLLFTNTAYSGRLFRVIIEDDCGSTEISAEAEITVNQITPLAGLTDLDICEGQSFSLGSGTAPATQNYQWQINANDGSGWQDLTDDANISGSATSFLLVNSAPIDFDGDSIRILITANPCEPITNGIAVIVNSGVNITTQPQDTAVCTTENALFFVEETGATSYQWQVFDGANFIDLSDNANINGSNTDSLTLVDVDALADGTLYRVVMQSSCGDVTSASATLSVTETPNILDENIEIQACEGDSDFFFIEAQNATNIQWQIFDGTNFIDLADDVNYAGTNLDTLFINNIPASFDGNTYRAFVENACGQSVLSAEKTITLFEPIQASIPTDSSICSNDIIDIVPFNVSGDITNFQWQTNPQTGVWSDLSNDATFSGANDTVLSITNPSAALNGHFYRLSLEGVCGNVTTNEFELEIFEVLVINDQPVDANICGNEEVIFTVDASNVTNIQWQSNESGVFADLVDDANYSGVNTASLSIENITTTLENVLFRVFLEDNCGNAIFSDEASISLENPANITNLSNDTTFCSSEDFFFFVATDEAVASYQWQMDDGGGFIDLAEDAIFSNVNSDTVLINGDLSLNNNTFRVFIEDFCGNTFFSNEISLEILESAEIINQPESVEVCEGEEATFTVVATGNNLVYQWSENGVAIPGANGDSFTISNADLAQNGNVYTVEITDDCANITSAPIILTIAEGNQIVDQTETINQCGGFNFSLFVEAENATAYQWQIDTGGGYFNLNDGELWDNLFATGTTTPNFTLSNFDLFINNYTFRVAIDGGCANTFSEPISVNISVPAPFDFPETSFTLCDDEESIFFDFLPTTSVWSNGNVGQFLFPEASGTYFIEFSDANDCVVNESIEVEFVNCEAICFVELPTAFSPDANNINDIFRPLLNCTFDFFEFSIFNRWGELVYFSTDERTGWNGFYQGKAAPIGTYVWYLEYKFAEEELSNSKKGNVTVVR